MATNQAPALACPREMADGTPCECDVVVELEWEPPDPNYGADADGNRGMYVPGYWYVEEVAGTCSAGHALTAEEMRTMEARAEELARDYTPEETY